MISTFFVLIAANIKAEDSQETQIATQTEVKWRLICLDYLRERERSGIFYYASSNKVPEIIFSTEFTNYTYLDYFTAIFLFTKAHQIKFDTCKAPPLPMPQLVRPGTSPRCSCAWGTVLTEHPGADTRDDR